MNGCIYRTRSDLCMKFTTDKSISFCVGKKCPDRKESNADHIRSMTDEELARILARGCHETRECPTICDPIHPYDEVVESCEKCWLEWLKQESEGE